MATKHISWNEKGRSLVPPIERARFERGDAPRRLEGALSTDPEGQVWLTSAGLRKLVGSETAVISQGSAKTTATGKPRGKAKAPAAPAPLVMNATATKAPKAKAKRAK